MIPPLISVVIPAYNHENFVERTLKSILEQNYSKIQLVIIDDGSSDNTPTIIKHFLHQHKTRFTNTFYLARTNRGLAKTLNECLEQCNGKYIYLLASDDLATKDALSTLAKTMEKNPELGMACGDAKFIDDAEQTTVRKSGKKEYKTFVPFFTRNRKYYPIPFNIKHDFGTYESLIGGNYIPIGPMMRRDIFPVIGPYNTNLIYEDYDCWLRIAQHYPIKLVDKTLSLYRTHNNNSNNTLRHQISLDRIKIHMREKEYSLNNDYKNAWCLKLVELALGLLLKRQWLELKNLLLQNEFRHWQTGVILFIKMLVCRSLKICKKLSPNTKQ